MSTRPYLAKGPVVVLASVVLGSAAQLLLKAAMQHLAAGGEEAPAALMPAVLWLIPGLLCYAASMGFWLIALSRYELSVAYPVLGLGYPLVFAVAVWCPFFAEEASVSRLAGIVLILAGVTLVTRSGRSVVPRDGD